MFLTGIGSHIVGSSSSDQKLRHAMTGRGKGKQGQGKWGERKRLVSAWQHVAECCTKTRTSLAGKESDVKRKKS